MNNFICLQDLNLLLRANVIHNRHRTQPFGGTAYGQGSRKQYDADDKTERKNREAPGNSPKVRDQAGKDHPVKGKPQNAAPEYTA